MDAKSPTESTPAIYLFFIFFYHLFIYDLFIYLCMCYLFIFIYLFICWSHSDSVGRFRFAVSELQHSFIYRFQTYRFVLFQSYGTYLFMIYICEYLWLICSLRSRSFISSSRFLLGLGFEPESLRAEDSILTTWPSSHNLYILTFFEMLKKNILLFKRCF